MCFYYFIINRIHAFYMKKFRSYTDFINMSRTYTLSWWFPSFLSCLKVEIERSARLWVYMFTPVIKDNSSRSIPRSRWGLNLKTKYILGKLGKKEGKTNKKSQGKGLGHRGCNPLPQPKKLMCS